MSSQITTISVFKFDTFRTKTWAFGMMQYAHKPLSMVSGQTFYKLMGSGKAFFNPFPDWGTYVILQVWNDMSAAQNYFEAHPLFRKYEGKSKASQLLFLENVSSKGTWSANNPFEPTEKKSIDGPLAVITRATIKTKLLLKFWRYVPKSQTNLWDNEGLLYTKGIGELPFAQMATFSIWKDIESLKNFAYKGKGHREAIKKTHQINWYKEELFARFRIIKSVGSLLELPIIDTTSAEKGDLS